MKRAILLSFGLVLVAFSICTLLTERRDTFAEMISKMCPTEWHQLDTAFPSGTTYYKEKSLKAEWMDAISQSHDPNQPLYRPLLAVAFVHDLNRSFMALQEAGYHTQRHFKRTQLQLDLMNCLKVPIDQHDATIARFRQEIPLIETAEVAHFLKLSETPYCLKLDRTFESYMTLNPTDESHYPDYINLLSDPAEECTS